MQRVAYFAFGVACHALFLGVFLWMMLFVGNIALPWTIDSPASSLPAGIALLVNLVLLAGFSAPHSIMARPAFKAWWTRIVPKPIERSVYVLVSCLLMILLLLAWQPINVIVWDVQQPILRGMLWGLFVGGWLLIPITSLMINHFDLFGTRQTWLHLRDRTYTFLPFRTPMLYKLVRHPLYVGWMTAFWATPTMTAGHLLFATVLTAYMLIAIPLEERDLVDLYGEKYLRYREQVPALIPRFRGAGLVNDETPLDEIAQYATVPSTPAPAEPDPVRV